MLNVLLKGAGLTTGTLPIGSNTSHSSLDVAKKFLLGQEQFKGGESYLIFGNWLHLAFANYPRRSNFKCTVPEATKLSAMIEILYKNKIVAALVSNALREQIIFADLNGCRVKMILDVWQQRQRVGSDLKSTACKTYKEFLAKAILYGYFRQGLTYIKGVNLKEFYFIGICTEPPHELFILNVHDFPAELAYAEQELEFLLYFYKHYGKAVIA